MSLDSPSVVRWLSRIGVSSRVYYRRIFQAFLGWAGETPDELLEEQREHRDFRVLDRVQEYILSLEAREGYKVIIYSVIKSFFMHNRLPLPTDPGFKIRGDRPKVVGSLALGEVSRVLDSCNEVYRAVFLCMFQGGMGSNELVHWSDTGWEALREQLRSDERFIRVDLPGRKKAKNIRPFYTFIGRDAMEALRIWLKVRGNGDGSIFLNQFDKPINWKCIHTYWSSHLLRLGIIERPENPPNHIRYGKNPHELRDLFRTRWQKSGRAPEVAEFFMGHNIDPLGYNKAMSDRNYTRNEYRQASKWLNIISEDPEHIHIDEVEDMRSELKDEIIEQYEKAMHEKDLIMSEVLKRLEYLERHE